MGTLVEYQLVRIVKLPPSGIAKRVLGEPSEYDGWRLNQRLPAVGDVGAVLDVLHAPGHRDRYVVECSGPDGVPIWLGDFDAEELEPA